MKAIILGAGMSKRMKRNKLLIKFKGKFLIEAVIEKVLECNFDEVIIVYKDKEIREVAEKYNLKSIYNENYYKGQSESIKLAVNNIDNGDFMFFTGDMPLLKTDTINYLIEIFNENKGIIVPRVKNGNRNPVIFENKYKAELLNLQGDVGGREVIKNNINEVTFIDFDDEDEFFDIDCEEDLEYIERKYGQ